VSTATSPGVQVVTGCGLPPGLRLLARRSRRFQNAAGPKELHWIDGASHNDLYYKKQYVDPSVEKLTGFFTQNLGQAA
jgi:hypothetical protein